MWETYKYKSISRGPNNNKAAPDVNHKNQTLRHPYVVMKTKRFMKSREDTQKNKLDV